MKQSYRENGASRVNLSVDIETPEGVKKVKLPHKILVLGDFSAGRSKERIRSKQLYPVTNETRDAVMMTVSPTLNLSLDNKNIQLNFNSLFDFHPDALVKQVPSLSQLLAMRHLLKELRSHVVENQGFKQRLSDIVINATQRYALTQEIEEKL